MKNKVDEGFEFSYWKLSYRRKFIRTLWQTPIIILIIGFIVLQGEGFAYSRVLPVILIISYIWQLIYTYRKWKKES